MTYRFETRWRKAARCSVTLLLLGLSAWPSLGSAQAEPPQRVLLVAPAEAELTARIRGQTRDLGVALEVADGAGPQDARAAASKGWEHGAAIVVWTAALGGADLDVYVLEVASGELRTRRVSTPAQEALASSTTAEMAALVIRSELSALLLELKAEREQALAQAAQPASAPPAQAPQGNPTTGGPEPRLRPWSLSLAYRPSRPLADTFVHGFSLALQRDLAGFSLGLSAIGTLPFTLAKAGTELRLNRFQLRLEGRKRWQVSAAVSLLLGVAAGLTVDFRSTEKVPPPMVATGDAATLTGGFGLLGQCEWMFSRHLGGVLGLGADVVPWRTEFVYEDGGDGGTVARLSWLDIWALVGFFTRFGA